MEINLENYKPAKPTKQELLEQYSRKEPKLLFEFDGFSDEKLFDNIIYPDRDGHCLFRNYKWEFMGAYWNIRVIIRPDTPKKDILAMLGKIMSWISEHEVDEQDKLKIEPVPTRLNDIEFLENNMKISEKSSEEDVIQEDHSSQEDVP